MGRWIACLLIAVITGAAGLLAWFLPRLRVEVSLDMLVGNTDAAAAVYTVSRAKWGSDEFAIVCLRRADGHWFTPEAVRDLVSIVQELKAVPSARAVTSILDVPLLRQQERPNPNLLLFQRDIRRLDAPDVDLDRARQEITGHEYARNNIISPDGHIMNVLVHLDDANLPAGRAAAEDEMNRRRIEAVQALRAFARTWTERLGRQVHLTNVPIINVSIIEHIRHDLRVFGVAALVLFLLGFFVIYRRVRFVLLPVATAALPVLLTVGYMSWKGISLTVITSNMPLLLFVLMLPYTVYLLERYREDRLAAPDAAGPDSARKAARDLWMPCLFSCLTTMAGFCALALGDIKPVRLFGIMMAAGMALGLVVVFLYLISWLAILPASRFSGPASPRAGGLVRFFANLATARPRTVIALGVLGLVAGAAGAVRLSSENKFTNYFWPGNEVHDGLEFIDRNMGGTIDLEVLIRAPEPGFFLTGAGFAAIEAVERFGADVSELGNIRSLNILRRELRKTFSRERFPGMTDAALLGLLRMQAPTLLTDHVDAQAQETRIFLRMRETAPTLDRNRILAELRAHLRESPELENLNVRVTGIFQLYAMVLNNLIESQKSTFGYVLLALFAMLLVNFGVLLRRGGWRGILLAAPALAALVLVPQVLPAILMLGLMGWTGIPLDMVTVMIAAIAMGVGIDAGIQYTVRYLRELQVTGDRAAAIERAHSTIGRAIWIATTVIVAGFCVLVFSGFRPSVWFGVLTAVAMLFSQLSALTLLPAILVAFRQPLRPRPWDEDRDLGRQS